MTSARLREIETSWKSGTLNPNQFDLVPDLLPRRERSHYLAIAADGEARFASPNRALIMASEALKIAEEESIKALCYFTLARCHRKLGDNEESFRNQQSYEQIFDQGITLDPRMHSRFLNEKAIYAFVQNDFQSAAWLHQRAALVAQSINAHDEAARSYLNAAVSWQRVGDSIACDDSLTRGRKSLIECDAPLIENSFILFEWQLELAKGQVFRPYVELSDPTPSQTRLAKLYSYERAVNFSTSSEIQDKFHQFSEAMSRLKDRQFETEARKLENAYKLLHSGVVSGDSLESTLCQIEELDHVKLCAEEGVFALIFGMIDYYLVESKWTSLQRLYDVCQMSHHQFLNALARRIEAWQKARLGDLEFAKGIVQQLLNLEVIDHFPFLKEKLQFERQLFAGSGDINYGCPWQNRIYRKAITYLPKPDQCLVISHSKSQILNSDTAISQFQRMQATSTICIDGIQERVEIDHSLIDLRSKPIPKGLLFSLLRNIGTSVSKQVLVEETWQEAYNPTLHDTLIHNGLRRLRKLHPYIEAQIETSGAGWVFQPDDKLIAILPDKLSAASKGRLNDRQLAIVSALKYRGKLRRTDLQEVAKASARTVGRDLADLVSRKIVYCFGSGPATNYALGDSVC